ncbi:unnamed protein product, partial [Mesorhabditis belari]|uniref:Metalloendopeptidase n=1 Tax=Mesorhabditis belari TaxID=2138241 RepID=A0AAF3FD56_9BILA
MRLSFLLITILGQKCLDATVSEYLTEDDFLRPLSDDVTFLTDEDFANAEKLRNETIPASVTLSQQPFHRGDIRGKAAWRLKTKRKGARRNGVISGVKKWPSGRIPYVISSQYNERERAVLARSFQEYHKRTCVRFAPRNAFDKDYLYIGKIDGCFSDVGRAGGRQELSLDDGCLQYDTAIHELMHSVGFYHEHERWDRDQHISILWHNIDRDAYDQFGKVDLSESSYYGQPYDYHSIMHYDSLAFSKNGYETMVAKRAEMTSVIGSAIDFSPVDLVKINLMYGCTEQSPLTAISPNTQIAPAVISPALPVSVGGVKPIITSSSLGSSFGSLSSLTSLGSSMGTLASTSMSGDQECRDRTNLCWRWLDRCKSFFFEKIMKEFCALSCGYCTPLSVSPMASVARESPRPLYQRLG